MKTKMSAKKITLTALSLIMCILMMLSFAACKKDDSQEKEVPATTQSASSDEVATDSQTGKDESATTAQVENDEYADVWADATYTEDTVIGTGDTTFYFEAQVGTHSVTFTVNTDKDTVGAALLEHGIIAGDDGDYGLYVKTVNGILADYDVNSTYWGFYQDGEYMMTGVDATDVESGAHYEMVYTEG